MSRTDSDSFTGSIADTASETLEVSASDADRLVFYVDDGTADGAPAQHTLTVRGYSPEEERFKFHSEATGETARSWEMSALGSKTQVEVTNTSGGSATFEMTLEARSQE